MAHLFRTLENVDVGTCWDAIVDTYMKVDTCAPVEQQAHYIKTYARFKVFDYTKRWRKSTEYVDTAPTPFDYGHAARVADNLKALGADGHFTLDILVNGCPLKYTSMWIAFKRGGRCLTPSKFNSIKTAINAARW